MSFVHPLLLGGLALVAVPLVIHLLMRQKPKRLPFPAFRFLLQKQRTNQTRLRLRHLLLLLLRMAIIAALCLALVRPKQEGGPIDPLNGQPVVAILVVDTSYSMEYAVGGQTRLDEAKRRGLEFLDELPEGSRVAILDSAESGGEWSASLPLARERLTGLKLRHDNAALPRQIEQGYRLLADLPREQEQGGDALPRVLCVVSDRTLGCWDEGAARTLPQPADVSPLFLDVGVEKPTDLAIVEVKPEVATVRPGETIHIDVTVQATGGDFDTQISCLFDGVAVPSVPTQSLKIAAGRSQVIRFDQRAARPDERDGLAPGLHQVEVRIESNDALPFNNIGFATFRVLESRGVLVLTDDTDEAKSAAQTWARLFVGTHHPDIRSPESIREVKVSQYQVVSLVNLARPTAELWKWLQEYVSSGGGVVVVPGGQGWRPNLDPKNPESYQGNAALALLPARINAPQKAEGKKGGLWYEFEVEPDRLTRHPLLAPFRRWKDAGVDFFEEGTKARAERFWQVELLEGATVLTHYATDDGAGSPALLERGRVVMLTTSFDRSKDENGREWNNYFLFNSFGFVLPNAIVSYLAGDADAASLTFVAGQTVIVRLAENSSPPSYQLSGPGIAGNDAILPHAEKQTELRIAHAVTPGNYTVLSNEGRAPRRVRAFSIIPRRDEYLLDRVPVEQIEERLGKDSVLPVGRTVSLRDRLQTRWTPPQEWAPWLLMLLLLVLAIEPLVANRFYRRRDNATAAPGPTIPNETTAASEARPANEPVGVPGP